MKHVLTMCDILLIQEHWLFQDDICALVNNVDNVSINVSGMDQNVLLSSRPYGGCAIIVNNSLTVQAILNHYILIADAMVAF